MACTTDSWDKLAKPELRAKQLAAETSWVEITTGTEKQIKYAKDLREGFVKRISHRDNDLPVRAAALKWERDEQLNKLDISSLAHDAWDRRTVTCVNVADAKTIIDWFVSTDGQVREHDSIGRYEHIIANPTKWAYDSNKGWIRTSYK